MTSPSFAGNLLCKNATLLPKDTEVYCLLENRDCYAQAMSMDCKSVVDVIIEKLQEVIEFDYFLLRFKTLLHFFLKLYG
jgi:hypothetical protein